MNTYHVRFGLQTHAGTENVGQRAALLGEGVDDWCTRRRQRCLEHVAEDRKHAVEALKFFLALALPLNTRHHFRDEYKINDQRRSKERVFADVEDPVEEDLW